MTDSAVIANAAAAAETPANGAPAPVAPKPTPAPSPSVADAAETALIATAQWHLQESTKGAYTPTLPKPSDFVSRTTQKSAPPVNTELQKEREAQQKIAADAEKARLAALPEVERRRQFLSNPDNPDGIWSTDAAKKAEAMTELRSIMARSEGTATSTTADDLSDEEATRWAGDVREQLGVVHPDWQGDVGVAAAHEGNVLSYLAREGFDARTIQEMATDFYGAVQAAGGLPESGALDVIKARYGKVLGPQRLALLQRWWDEEVVGGQE